MTHTNTAFANPATSVNMNARQAPLISAYKTEPAQAKIVDFARTTSENLSPTAPLHAEVLLTQHDPYSVPIGVHTAVGGNCDLPTPGDMLCGALAACLDSTIRIIANKVGIPLLSLSVSVSGTIDVRGTLRVKKEVPVGFQSMNIQVNMKAIEQVSEAMLQQLVSAAEYSCVILQTLKYSPKITLNDNN